MAQVLISSGSGKIDNAGNTMYIKALKQGYYAGGATTSTASFGNLNVTAALTLDPGLHEGLVVCMNSATGFTITLPTATGSGNYFDVLVTTTVTSGNHVVKTGGSDHLVGTVQVSSTATNVSIGCQSTNTTITMSGTTTGGLVGSWLHFQDIAANQWYIDANLVASGTAATPVS